MTKTLNLSDIFTALGYFPKTIRVISDGKEAFVEWQRIGGSNASTADLLNFLSNYSVNLVEYATWTPITTDDQIVQIIRYILIDHRDSIIQLLDWIKQDKEPSTVELMNMAEAVSVSTTEECNSPTTVLYVLMAILQALRYLKTEQNVTPNTIEKITVDPPEANRPVLNFVRKVFGKK
jgi:hypothetical protein